MNHSCFLNLNDISSHSWCSYQWQVLHWIFLPLWICLFLSTVITCTASPRILLPTPLISVPPTSSIAHPHFSVCVCVSCVGGRPYRGAGAADSCCIHACSIKSRSLAAVPCSCLLLQSLPWIFHFWRDAGRRGWQWICWGQLGEEGCWIERLGSYLRLTPSASHHMWASCCIFVLAVADGPFSWCDQLL